MKRCAIVIGLAVAVFLLPPLARAEQASGTWAANSINGRSIPGAAWTRVDQGRECSQEVVGATLLLDSTGNWAGLFTVRNRCKGDPAPKKGSETASLVGGTFAVNGEALTLEFPETGQPMRGTISAE